MAKAKQASACSLLCKMEQPELVSVRREALALRSRTATENRQLQPPPHLPRQLFVSPMLTAQPRRKTLTCDARFGGCCACLCGVQREWLSLPPIAAAAVVLGERHALYFVHTGNSSSSPSFVHAHRDLASPCSTFLCARPYLGLRPIQLNYMKYLNLGKMLNNTLA